MTGHRATDLREDVALGLDVVHLAAPHHLALLQLLHGEVAAAATPWKAASGKKRRSAAPLPAEPGRTQLHLVQPAKLRRVQAAGRDSWAPDGALQSGGHAAGGACQAVDAVADEADSPPAERNTSGGMSPPAADGIIFDDDGPFKSLSRQPGMMCSHQRPGVLERQNGKASWVQARSGSLSHGASRAARQQTLLT